MKSSSLVDASKVLWIGLLLVCGRVWCSEIFVPLVTHGLADSDNWTGFYGMDEGEGIFYLDFQYFVEEEREIKKE